MATVKDIVKRAEGLLGRYTVKAGVESYMQANQFLFIKDAYDEITKRLRVPIAQNTQSSVVNQAAYNLPSDIFGNFRGIISVEFDGRPIDRNNPRALQELYYEDWKNPPGYSYAPMYYIQYKSVDEIYFVGPPGTVKNIVITYVKATDAPTALTDTVPTYAVDFIRHIPDYMVGKALNFDKMGRGSGMISAFKQNLIEIKREDKRERVRRKGREAYTYDLMQYRKTYGRNTKRGT